MAEPRRGRQTPTKSHTLPYTNSHGKRAIDFYNTTGRMAQEWQELLTYDIEAVDDDGLWVHQKFGLAVPRQNGKNEVIAIAELDDIRNGLNILHTAHRTNTSTAASRRIATLLDAAGYTEVMRPKKEETYEKSYTYSKQVGMERIVILDNGGGTISFRTRSAKGGLGESYDILVIDEAQEYTDDEQSALQYVIAASDNPQILFIGTPPTVYSSGTVFTKMRTAVLGGETEATGWAEWSVDRQSDPNDRDVWYETNPSLGYKLKERTIAAENKTDEIDFNIQRFGLWLHYNQKSEITENEWNALKVDKLPELVGKLHVGIKYGHDGGCTAMSIAVKTEDNKIFVESIDCRPFRKGNQWILDFLHSADVATVTVDGQNGQGVLAEEMKQAKLKPPILPTVKEIVAANSAFVLGLSGNRIRHAGQKSLALVATNCKKRAIGSGGGFGFCSILDGAEIALLDSVILAYSKCADAKEKKKQKIGY